MLPRRLAPAALPRLGLLAGAAALTLVCGTSQRALRALPAGPPMPGDAAPPSAQVLRRVAAGYRSAAADMLYLQAVTTYGSRSNDPKTYVLLAPLLQRCIALDPQFAAAYMMAGTALTANSLDVPVAMALLKQGAAALPHDWRLQFLYGFNVYDRGGDVEEAARALARAAREPGAPAHLAPLAARLAAEAHDPTLGIEMLDALIDAAADEDVRASYLQRRLLLELELALGHAQAAVDAYARMHGRAPRHLQQLVAAGLLAELPGDPLGGPLGLDAHGQVTTAHEALRLRHKTRAAGATPAAQEAP